MTASDDVPSVDYNEQISQKFGMQKSCKLTWRQNKQYFPSWLKKKASAKKFTIGCNLVFKSQKIIASDAVPFVDQIFVFDSGGSTAKKPEI